MSTPSHAYIVTSLFTHLVLSLSQDGKPIIHKNGQSYDANRQEAANLLRYARAKNGLISKIKTFSIC
jgi:hypothetical protein